jgi:hypothetical protein
MDARRFPTEPRIGESENPRTSAGLRFALSGRALTLVTFFLAKKESDPAAQRAEALRFARPASEPDFTRIGKRCAIAPSTFKNPFFRHDRPC